MKTVDHTINNCGRKVRIWPYICYLLVAVLSLPENWLFRDTSVVETQTLFHG